MRPRPAALPCTVALLSLSLLAASAAFAQTPPPASAPPASTPTAAPPAATPVFPDKIDPKYASLKPGAARRKTCDDQYKANKLTGGNAGLKWIAKNGYYSQCSKHLKALPAS